MRQPHFFTAAYSIHPSSGLNFLFATTSDLKDWHLQNYVLFVSHPSLWDWHGTQLKFFKKLIFLNFVSPQPFWFNLCFIIENDRQYSPAKPTNWPLAPTPPDMPSSKRSSWLADSLRFITVWAELEGVDGRILFNSSSSDGAGRFFNFRKFI